MKAYTFRFEKLLKSKKIVVDDLSSKTARARRILLLESRKLEDFKGREIACFEEVAIQQTGTVNAGEVQRAHQYLQLLGKAIGEQTERVKEISRRVDALRAMLVEAEKERKILEKLDEKEREEFYDSFLKKEQSLLDEVGITRFVLRNAHSHFHSNRSQ